jgi:hypothetical protein
VVVVACIKKNALPVQKKLRFPAAKLYYKTNLAIKAAATANTVLNAAIKPVCNACYI